MTYQKKFRVLNINGTILKVCNHLKGGVILCLKVRRTGISVGQCVSIGGMMNNKISSIGAEQKDFMKIVLVQTIKNKIYRSVAPPERELFLYSLPNANVLGYRNITALRFKNVQGFKLLNICIPRLLSEAGSWGKKRYYLRILPNKKLAYLCKGLIIYNYL